MSDQDKSIPTQPNNPLHGVKLADVLALLLETYGWDELGRRVNIRCFNFDPSINSSLKFLRKNQWARDQVEALYLRTIANKR
jgi:uncharacterized protein (DUF2132 family)